MIPTIKKSMIAAFSLSTIRTASGTAADVVDDADAIVWVTGISHFAGSPSTRALESDKSVRLRDDNASYIKA
jgi:hypothetical protein